MEKKTYTELIQIDNFEDRLKYLLIPGQVGAFTFNGSRYLNQNFYHSPEWRRIRRSVILRDDGCDLGHPNYPIGGQIYVHHINPITIEDLLQKRYCVFDLENLISSSMETHQAIHYGANNVPSFKFVERKPGDTCPWR